MIRKNLFVVAMLSVGSLSLHAVEKPLHKRLSRPDLNTSLEIFNMWGDQAVGLQNILKFAYPYLKADPKATIAGLAATPEFQELCKEAGLTHLGGPMLGNVSSMGVAVWIRTLKPALVSVEMTTKGGVKTFGPVASTVESDLSAVVQVTGLEPGSESAYRVLIDGVPVKTAEPTTIRTTPDDGESVRIAFGSCWHRWGLGHPQMNLVKGQNPSVLLMLGDIAVQDRMGNLGMHRYDYLQRDLTPVWRDFASNVPVIANWDDHDYGKNDFSGVSEEFTADDRSGIRKVFAQSWVNPQYGNEGEQSGIYLRTRVGPCDVIMTDNRSLREQGKGKDHFLGHEQMDWVKKQLLSCKGPFIILSCGTMWNDAVSGGKDSWGSSDPEGREEIFKFIEDHRIPGVLLISGDRHGARGFTIPRQNGFGYYEFEGASYGGRIGPAATDPKWTEQLYGIAGEYAFSVFEFDTAKEDPEVTFRLFGETGAVIHELKLTRSQLTPK